MALQFYYALSKSQAKIKEKNKGKGNCTQVTKTSEVSDLCEIFFFFLEDIEERKDIEFLTTYMLSALSSNELNTYLFPFYTCCNETSILQAYHTND